MRRGRRAGRDAEFFSFGTNDLTQTTYGYSRDDAEASFIPRYIEKKILKDDPFQVLDRVGVGELMRDGHRTGRGGAPDLKIGICGEHGGDPRASVSATNSDSTTSRARRTASDRAPRGRAGRPRFGLNVAAAMTIDGAALARSVIAGVAADVARLGEECGIVPGLAVVLVGDDPASAIYVRSKDRRAREAGIASATHLLPAATSETNCSRCSRC